MAIVRGGIVLRNSLSLLKGRGYNLSGVTARFSGAAVNETSTRLLLGSYGVTVKEFVAHPLDLVPNVAGYNSLFPPNPARFIGSSLTAPALFTPYDWNLSPHTTHLGGGKLAWFPWIFNRP